MSDKIYIFDTTLRDGAQTQGVDFSLEEKEKIADEELKNKILSLRFELNNNIENLQSWALNNVLDEIVEGSLVLWKGEKVSHFNSVCLVNVVKKIYKSTQKTKDNIKYNIFTWTNFFNIWL